MIIEKDLIYFLNTNLVNYHKYMFSENVYKYISDNSEDIIDFNFDKTTTTTTITKYTIKSPFPNFLHYLFKNTKYIIEDKSIWDFTNNTCKVTNHSSFHKLLDTSFESIYSYTELDNNLLKVNVKYIFTINKIILPKKFIKSRFISKMMKTHNERVDLLKKFIDMEENKSFKN